MLRVLVDDESVERAAVLREGFSVAGYEIIGSLESALELAPAIEREMPEIVVIATDSPSRDALDHVSRVSRARSSCSPTTTQPKRSAWPCRPAFPHT
jgi:AmiR/NasT family two-component response regulator